MNSLIIATQTNTPILKQLAIVMGYILDFIYRIFAHFDIYNIGLFIIVFTIVVRMLMLPMTIKQQKFTRLNSVMAPEIKKIQNKYKDRKDQQSQMEMQEEITSVYDKYGVSPTGSCLQLIIQMPILFALYRVIYNIPAYVGSVKNLYINVITKLDASMIEKYFGIKGKIGAKLSTTDLNKCIDILYTRKNGKKELTADMVNEIFKVANPSDVNKIKRLNNFFGLDISQSPSALYAAGTALFIVLIIPILAGIFQFISVQVTSKLNESAQSNDTMASSMKIMNYVMPLFSVYMCYILQIGIGIYWCAGSLIMLIQQIFINIILKNEDLDELVEKNKEKAAVKAAKRKERQGIYREKILEASKVNAKNVNSSTDKEKEEKIRIAKEKAAKSSNSIASKANLVQKYNEKNNK